MRFIEERNEIVKTGKMMLSEALTVGTWGNISMRLGENLLAITPSGMEYQELLPEDISILDLEGKVIEGKRKPSTEHPLHRIIYKKRLDIKAIVHTHSIYATALAVARKNIPGCIEDLVQIAGGEIRVANYALPGTEEVGKNAVEAMAGRNGVLLANHGVVGAGRDLKEALRVCQVIEKAARIVIAAQSCGGIVELDEQDIKIMREYYLNSYGQR